MRSWVAVGVIGVMAVAAQRSLGPPSVSPERAASLQALHRELFTDTPRYVGSAEARAARGRIRRALDDAGCETSTQIAWSCGKKACAYAENVWCRIGPEVGEPIVGMAHTDSVAAGPGAADDGAGVVAWVDTVRSLQGTTLTRPLVLVLTDAEEPGLLGARAWFADPRVPLPYAAVVNLEARGTTGAAFLFQTVGPPTPWGARAATLPTEPRASSLYPTVYQWIPNDTDLTVAAAAGVSGVNHAFLGELPRYHTVRDDLAHLDPRSLAHHADLARGWVLALQVPSEGAADVFTDVAGAALLRWPRSLAAPLTIAVALLLVGVAGLDLRAGRIAARGAGKAVGASVGAAVASVALAEGLGAATRALGDGHWYHPEAVVVASLAAAAAVWVWVGAAGNPLERWASAALGVAALAVSTALVDPGFTVLGLLPAVVGLLARLLPERVGVGGLLLGICVPALPLALGLPVVLGVGHPAVAVVPWCLVCLAAAPLWPERPRAWSLAAGGIAFAAWVAAVASPPDPDRPDPVNVTWDDAAGTLTRVHERGRWSTSDAVTPLGLPRATQTWLSDTVLHVVPARGGRIEVSTATPYGAAGQSAPAEVTEWWGAPPEGVWFQFASAPAHLRVREITVGLPSGVDPAREPHQTALQRGDRTITE